MAPGKFCQNTNPDLGRVGNSRDWLRPEKVESKGFCVLTSFRPFFRAAFFQDMHGPQSCGVGHQQTRYFLHWSKRIRNTHNRKASNGGISFHKKYSFFFLRKLFHKTFNTYMISWTKYFFTSTNVTVHSSSSLMNSKKSSSSYAFKSSSQKQSKHILWKQSMIVTILHLSHCLSIIFTLQAATSSTFTSSIMMRFPHLAPTCSTFKIFHNYSSTGQTTSSMLNSSPLSSVKGNTLTW